MRKYIEAMRNKHPQMDWEDLLPSMMLSYNCHVHRATGDSPFAHDPRLPSFDIEKPRMFYDSSYVSDMYEISRAAHKVAKENLEERRDRQEGYYHKKTKYRTFTPGDQVIIYYPNPPPGISPKFHIFGKTFRLRRCNITKNQLLCTLTDCSILTRPEVRRKGQRTFIASGSTSKQSENGQDWTGKER
jgi:hypothetical protein